MFLKRRLKIASSRSWREFGKNGGLVNCWPTREFLACPTKYWVIFSPFDYQREKKEVFQTKPKIPKKVIKRG